MKRYGSFLLFLMFSLIQLGVFAANPARGGEAADPGKPSESRTRFTLPIGFPFGVSSRDSNSSSVKKDTTHKVIKGSIPSKKKVYQLNITDENTSASWRQTEEAFRQAQDMNADFILIHVEDNNAYNTANKIRSQLFHYKTPVLLYVENKLTSSNAIIPLNEDTLARLKSGSILSSPGKQAPVTYSTKHTSAVPPRQKNGFADLKKCRKNDDGTYTMMSDPNKISFSGSTNEALQNAGLENFDIIDYKTTAVGNLVDSLAGETGTFVLIFLFVLGLFLEARSISNGLPLFISVCAMLLLFASHYFEGRMLWWEAGVFIIGLCWLLWEIYYASRSFLLGLPALLCVICGIALGTTGTDPLTLSTTFNNDIVQSFAVVISAVLLSLFVCYRIERYFFGHHSAGRVPSSFPVERAPASSALSY